MEFTMLVDQNSEGQSEIQMSFPVDILAKGSLRYDPPLDGIVIVSGGITTIRIPEFGIKARGKSVDEAEKRLYEETSELFRRSSQKPPDLTKYEARVVEKMRVRSNRPND